MIVGIGVDVVDLARFERAVGRTPALRERLFAESERDRPLRSLAGRFAAKEALMKALGDTTGIRWHDMVVTADADGDPSFRLSGAAKAIAERRGAARIHLTMSHDAGVAIAMVVAETAPETAPERGPGAGS
ncbi:holo-ACP synthase [Homoserinibacter sp. YIM 151385]|uniref:holo-ACP synthase n=1 Tax=Homoserinibacter sp. YIM 151385 TaxID=2985506 RepID=UPI0022F0B682|nr:holo-ACP synthase [Homoserinibacter sp. YIM 151385]WBU37712.1 holo-ACP synthase [Homoserinibacter sp. YIM 151385]